MNFLKTASFVSVLALLSPSAMAMPILIDGFTDFQVAEDTQTQFGPGSPTLLTGGSMLGGSRLFEVVNTSTPVSSGGIVLTSTGNGQGQFQQTPENALNFEAGSGQVGIATITYDARQIIAGPGPGLGGIDLTSNGTNTKFFFDIVGLTPNFPGTVISITVADGEGDSDTVDEILQPGFSEFTAFSNFDSAVDFSNVSSIAFSIDTAAVPGFDGTLGSISAVPLPLSSLLILGGLGGLVGANAVSKRRRKA